MAEEILTPEQAAGRQFAVDLKSLNQRVAEKASELSTLYAGNSTSEREQFKQNLLPLLKEAQALFARPGRRNGGMTFRQWMKKNRPIIKMSRSTVHTLLKEENMECEPTLPKIGELRIVAGVVGHISEIPAAEDGEKQQIVITFPKVGDVEASTDKVDMATTKLKKHVLDPDTVYIKANGDWCRYADGKLIVFLTAAQQTAARVKADAAKKAETAAVKKAKYKTPLGASEDNQPTSPSGEAKPLTKTKGTKKMKVPKVAGEEDREGFEADLDAAAAVRKAERDEENNAHLDTLQRAAAPVVVDQMENDVL
jgi:hypothetical protein